MTPFVSVIIPNYCHSKYLKKRIDSVLNQTYSNFEVIILDDCSPDNGESRKIIEQYRNNPHVSHIIYNDINSGSTFRQWEKGLHLAKGDVIWIAESDDYCEDNLLMELVNAYEKNSGTVIAYSTLLFVDSEDKLISNKCKAKDNQYLNGNDFVRDMLSLYNCIMNASCAIFSKSAALNIRNEYMRYKGAGDYLFWVEIALQGNVAIVNKQLSYFRRHDSVVTTKCYQDGTNYIEEKKVLDYISSNVIGWNRTLSNICYYQRLLYIKNKNFISETIRRNIFNLWGGEQIFSQKIIHSPIKYSIKCIDCRISIDRFRRTNKFLNERDYKETELSMLIQHSYFLFLLYYLKEYLLIGKCIANMDYDYACDTYGYDKNIFKVLISLCRVFCGAAKQLLQKRLGIR